MFLICALVKHSFARYQVCRRHWSEHSRAGVVGFDVNTQCLSLDKDLLSRAEALVAQKGVGSSTGQGQPHNKVCGWVLPLFSVCGFILGAWE